MNRLGLFCWNQSGQKQLEQHKWSIFVLSIKLALKQYCLTSSEWFRLFTAAEISDPDAQTAQLVSPKLLIDQKKTHYWNEQGSEATCGLSESDPKFKHLLVKEQMCGPSTRLSQ